MIVPLHVDTCKSEAVFCTVLSSQQVAGEEI